MASRPFRLGLFGAGVVLVGCLGAAPAAGAGPALPYDNAGTSDDANPGGADLDGGGASFSAQALAGAGWAPGATYTLDDGAQVSVPGGGAGQPDNVVATGQTVALRGTGAALDLVVTGTHGDTAGTATVHYADGGSQASPVAAPDWFTGTTGVAVVSAWRNTTGGRQYA
jgi:hypothetical protein